MAESLLNFHPGHHPIGRIDLGALEVVLPAEHVALRDEGRAVAAPVNRLEAEGDTKCDNLEHKWRSEIEVQFAFWWVSHEWRDIPQEQRRVSPWRHEVSLRLLDQTERPNQTANILGHL